MEKIVCPKCGNEKSFTAYQQQIYEVVVDSSNRIIESLRHLPDHTQKAFGPYCCSVCMHSFDFPDI